MMRSGSFAALTKLKVFYLPNSLLSNMYLTEH